MDEGKEPIYDDEPKGDLNEEYCDADYDVECLVIQCVMTILKDEQ